MDKLKWAGDIYISVVVMTGMILCAFCVDILTLGMGLKAMRDCCHYIGKEEFPKGGK